MGPVREPVRCLRSHGLGRQVWGRRWGQDRTTRVGRGFDPGWGKNVCGRVPELETGGRVRGGECLVRRDPYLGEKITTKILRSQFARAPGATRSAPRNTQASRCLAVHRQQHDLRVLLDGEDPVRLTV